MYELRGVSRTWKLDAVQVHALRKVDVIFERSVTTAIMGPSGSGKSTLLHVAALLDPPSTGGVWWDGRCVSALSDDDRSDFRCRRLGFVHQTFPMVAVLTPLENVVLPALYAGHNKRSSRQRAQMLLDRVGVGALAHRDARTLSGGERQRVAIARALMNEPFVVFADEPTAALDSDTGSQVLDLLFEIVRDEGTALVIATHDDRVAGRADRIVRLDGGSVVPPPEGGA